MWPQGIVDEMKTGGVTARSDTVTGQLTDAAVLFIFKPVGFFVEHW